MADQKQSIQSPPEPEIAIRTMASDIKSIEQSGGQAPAAEILNIKFKVKPEEAVQANAAPGTDFGAVGYSGPEKGIFSPGGIPTVEKQEPQKAIEQKDKSSILKLILIILLVVAVFAALGFFGYYVVSKWLFPVQVPAV